ncbi:ANTAR domain-containing protein [Streptomyces sp. FXJ1.172]|uniref:ANTAR domain-containing protein n=1 Tax=Streptomyces sp. FXJ1.172 TaxID=710705 RepID=UPI000D182F3D|nr:ANTAR domain-containing protein [Streptomyces sp. FXJ1.172]WEO99525.1 ANTAR domain-containing protein [Streptomyces sp. FXJ1.172]
MRVAGDLGLDNSHLLEHSLRSALGASAGGVDLDLSRGRFRDWSALDILLTVRREALAEAKTLTIAATSPSCKRLLVRTDTYPLFTPPGDSAAGAPGERPQAAGDEVRDGLGAEVVRLRRAMRTRPDIDLARGILMASFGLSSRDTWTVLVTASQRTNTKLYRLARDVVTTVTGDPLPESVRWQLSAAVAEVHARGERHDAASDGRSAGRRGPRVR